MPGYLIGATDEVVEGTWKWVTGEAWSFTNWSGGEPNNCCVPGGEDYLQLWLDGSSWNDIPMSSGRGWVRGYIVEYEGTSPVPEPETYTMLLAGLGLLGFAARRRKQRTA